MKPVRVALLDSGINGLEESVLQSSAVLTQPDGSVVLEAATGDVLGHGTALASTILSQAPATQLLNAQIFTQKLHCTPLQVATAVDWAVSEGAQLVNMSFGLGHDRPVLCAACKRAVTAGVILVAAAPAQGNSVFPAAYPGVIRATGDARCQPGEISFLDSSQADFGACVQATGSSISGASVGCAFVVAKIASYLAHGLPASPKKLQPWLLQEAHYRGREYREC